MKTDKINDNTTSVIIQVIDYGIGISAEDQDNIFDDNFRTSNMRAKELNPSSHGFGLSNCHRISTALKGKIKVKSEPGKGSEFTYKFTAKFTKYEKQSRLNNSKIRRQSAKRAQS